MLGSSDETAYDLRFRFLGVPVRVHPLFWLVMFVISGANKDLASGAVFVACAFLSVLVHEFGHGIAGRLMGDEPREIVLYSMGGYCAFHQARATRWRRIFMLLCGPGAGFLLFGLVLIGWLLLPPGEVEGSKLRLALADLLKINLVWGILNLFPLWPLDGGQILGAGLGMVSPRNGMRWAHVVGLLVAGAIAVWLATLSDWWMALWFGYFGFINYQMLQALHYASTYAEDPESWRR